MRTWILSTVAAVGLGLAGTANEASAAWVYRTTHRWDACCGRYVAYTERYWVPDCDPCRPDPCDAAAYYRGGYPPDHHHHDNHVGRPGFFLRFGR